jgi:RNA polymerase sigma-70 factor (ECF subfamily)
MINVMLDLDSLLKSEGASDTEVSEALVGAYYGYIYRLALSILNDSDDAEDAAQETFIRALLHLKSYQAGTQLRSWLSTIAVNICRDLLRRRKSRQTLTGVLHSLTRLTGAVSTPEDRAMRNEQKSTLWQAVQELDEKHRLPVLLRFVNGLSVREISGVLGINEGTVHSRLHYAVRRLKAQLTDANTDPFNGWEEDDNDE